MAIHPYLFRLKPVDTFFFGGERSFGYDGANAQAGVNANYFVKSNYYPQQTTLLGVLRYKLLEAKGWLATGGRPVPDKSNEWIGRHSFKNNDREDKSYGHIHGLSPLFWLHQDTSYLMAPFDWGISWQWQTRGGSTFLGQAIQSNLPKAVKGYDPKKGIARQLINRHGNTCLLDSVYVPQTQEGILKLDKRTEDEQGFYKQTYYRFATPDWSFAFVAYLADEAADTLTPHLLTNGWATVGGEGRPFRLTMEPVLNVADLLALPAQPDTGGPARLTLLSDALVTNEVYEHCDFAVSETVDFRAIETSNMVTNYADLNRDRKPNDAMPQRGQHRQLLLERGSVLYVKDGQTTALRQLLDKPRHFRRIGYNAYTLMNQVPDPTLFTPTPA
ncbi:type III-B CRISPR module-associated Cmr3 family protein [Spirosoma sordidisoli]|uniref:Uncharacterized protein n=1 Tax=Spirosoma sordidisoli TaxID=2502893 RepID=A0A4Q2UQT8_9BACT|nr:type III-B CRISPR module-associated Cmr3 family protein [Spirosoma sordidisoli]RYC70035.1 hypothetical protein EQG79_09195 [Spirosoma sordidisoli]